jgi:hypothetical protein
VANFCPSLTNLGVTVVGMWFDQSFSKGFQLGYPSTPNIATKLAEGIPSLKNLRPIPGTKLPSAPSGVVLVISGDDALEILTYP